MKTDEMEHLESTRCEFHAIDITGNNLLPRLTTYFPDVIPKRHFT